MNKTVTNFCYFAGIGLNARLETALSDAGVAEPNDLCRRISAYMLHSKSDNTVKKYFSAFQKWNIFCKQQSYTPIPAEPIHIVLYLTKLLDAGSSAGVISTAIYSLKWAHSMNGLGDPTENGFIKNLNESAKRLRSTKVVKKDAISTEMLIELCDLFKSNSDLLTLRDLSMILIGFAGFLRFDELVELRCCDIEFKGNFLSIQIRKSKTDVYRSGNEILISKGRSSACPYTMLQNYMTKACINTSLEKYLFRPIFRSGKSCRLLDKDKKLSYTRTREVILRKLKLVAPGLNLGVHSLRAGGVTTAANANVNDRCLKRHGRWKVDSSKDGYIQDSVQKRLKITESLHL